MIRSRQVEIRRVGGSDRARVTFTAEGAHPPRLAHGTSLTDGMGNRWTVHLPWWVRLWLWVKGGA